MQGPGWDGAIRIPERLPIDMVLAQFAEIENPTTENTRATHGINAPSTSRLSTGQRRKASAQ